MKLILPLSLLFNLCLALFLFSKVGSSDSKSSLAISPHFLPSESVLEHAQSINNYPPQFDQAATCPLVTIEDFRDQIDHAVYSKLDDIAKEDMSVFAYLESDSIGEYEVDNTGLLKVKDWYEYSEIEWLFPMLNDERKMTILDSLNTTTGFFKESLIKQINMRPVTGSQDKDAFYAAIDTVDPESTSALMLIELEMMRKCHYQRHDIDRTSLQKYINSDIREASQKRDVVALEKLLDDLVC
jgi:hypothetical protein